MRQLWEDAEAKGKQERKQEELDTQAHRENLDRTSQDLPSTKASPLKLEDSKSEAQLSQSTKIASPVSKHVITTKSPPYIDKEHAIVEENDVFSSNTNQMESDPSSSHVPPLPNDGDHATAISQQRTIESISKTFSPIREFFFVGIICAAQLYTQASLNQTLGLGRQISASFHITDRAEQAWFTAGYSLTVGTFILFSGRLGDIFGYKRILIIGYCWFAIWSIVAGLAIYADSVLFVWARVLTGIGPALCLPNALAILGATYPPGLKKSMFFSLFGAAAPNGAVLGLTFAGLFNLTYWPWAFWALGIAILFTAVLAYLTIPDVPPRRADHEHSPASYFWDLDIPGVVVGVAALVIFNFAWNQAPLVGWSKVEVIVTLVLGVLLIAAFFYIEIKVSHSPLIPFGVLKAEVSLVLAMMACGWACFGIWIYYVFQILEVLQNASPLLVAAKICPVAVTGAIAAICTGFLLQRFGPAIVMCISLIAFTTGAALVATVPIHQTYWAQLFVTMIVIPWGMDMSFPAATLILSNAVAREHQGVAASLVNTVVNYSISISLGIAGTIEVNINNEGDTQHDLQKGYRGALFLAVGLSAFGLTMGLLYTLKEKIGATRHKRGDAEKQGS